ncbi:MAG: dUTP diphosphatase [Nanoarchaeota archaeon]
MAKKSKDSKEVLKVMKLSKEAELPEYAMNCDTGFDFRASESVVLGLFEQKEVKTGVAVEIPEGYIGLVRDRAGIVSEMAVHVVAGTFSPSYRGEITIMMINFGEDQVKVEKGMRIAQMIIVPVKKVEIKEVKSLSQTERSGKSFYSTGIK